MADFSTDGFGSNYRRMVWPTITYAPGMSGCQPPCYTDWADVEDAVKRRQGLATLAVDTTGISGTWPQYACVPSTADLDGQGRLRIVGVGPQGEAGMIVEDGGQLRNVVEWREIVLLSSPKSRPSVLYSLSGMVVECFDATFMFRDATATQPVISAPVNSVPGNAYLVLYLLNSGFGNWHNPGRAVLDVGDGVVLLAGIGQNIFPMPYDQTISGPATASVQFQLDSSQPSFQLPQFLGPVSTSLVDDAANLAYEAASLADWSGKAPSTVKEALDRIAAKLGKIP